MLPIERQQRIIDELNINGRVLVAELVTLCQVSQETIRRDLSQLEKRGLLQRSHGGAVLAKKEINTSQNNTRIVNEQGLSFRQRINEKVDEKMAIAKRALDFVSPGDCILIDDSTTGWYFSRQLPDIELTVISNSLRVVLTLAARSNIRTICLGGEYSDRYESFHGVVTEQPLREFQINKIFFSCTNLSSDGYLREENENSAHLKQQMILAAERKYLLLDSSKFLHPSFARICHYRDVEFLITDQLKNKELEKELAWNGVNIIDCSQRNNPKQLIKN